MSEKLTQEAMILAYLKAGGAITSLESVHQFGCMRLAARIHSLRQRGNSIQDRRLHVNGKYFAEYFIPTEAA